MPDWVISNEVYEKVRACMMLLPVTLQDLESDAQPVIDGLCFIVQDVESTADGMLTEEIGEEDSPQRQAALDYILANYEEFLSFDRVRATVWEALGNAVGDAFAEWKDKGEPNE